MNDSIQFAYWYVLDTLWRFKDWAIDWLAWHAPRSLVYACSIRLMVNATTGIYGHDETPGVTCVDALWRWKA